MFTRSREVEPLAHHWSVDATIPSGRGVSGNGQCRWWVSEQRRSGRIRRL
jgi:hypothetical protein